MWETIVVLLTILAAAGGLGYSLYRFARGQAGCSGCRSCNRILSPRPGDPAHRDPCGGQGK